MTTPNTQNMKQRIVRRIVLKSVIFACWIVGLIVVMMQGGGQEEGEFYLTMLIALLAVWAVTTLRDVRRLRSEDYLRKAAIAENDERNMLNMYKATRLATVIIMCAIPLAMCVLAYFGMGEAITALGVVVCSFLVLYLACLAYYNRVG